jgi:flagellar basal-body rod protein FlgB
MSTSWIDDNALSTARQALNGLSMRQQVISQNIANVDTPGYKAQQVDFEDALQSAMSGGERLQMASSNSAHLASATDSSAAHFNVSQRPGGSERADENNVDVDVELTQMVETGIQYQAVAQSVTKKFQLLKSIAQSG